MAANTIDTSNFSEEEFAELAAEFTDIPFCPVSPNPGPQTMFLLDFSREALYGGAAGGGKSYAALMAASQFLDVPGYAALILRKNYSELTKPGALLSVAQDWWAGQKGIKYNTQEHSFTFPCNGSDFTNGSSSITFGTLDQDNDRFKYIGGAYHCIIFDELTTQKERDYTFLFSRMRRVSTGPLSRVPIRMRGTTNPGGPGMDWVFKRFIVPWQAWKAGKGPRPKRNFHPAVLSDNPKLDYDEYVESLNELDPVTRAQLLKGDWNIRPDGRMFKSEWFKPIPRSQVPGNCTWVRFWDMASTDPKPGTDPDWTVGILVGRSPDGRYFISDMRRFRHEPGESELIMRSTAMVDTNHVLQCVEQEPGASGKTAISHYRNYVFVGVPFRGVPSSGKGRGGTTTISSNTTSRAKIIAAQPVASLADAGQVYYVQDGSWDHEAFLDEVGMFPDSSHDDVADALSGSFSTLATTYQHNGLHFGDSLEMREPSSWIPDPLPSMNSKALINGEGWLGERLADTRALTEGDIVNEIRGAWAV